MSRELGAPLALSILAHGAAVAAIGVLAAAWLAGPPPAPPPPALYVDLVQPVVATSDRHETASASTPRSRVASGRAPAAVSGPPRISVATPPARPAAADRGTPRSDPEEPASAASGVPPPPSPPVLPDARAESAPPLAPAIPAPAPAPSLASQSLAPAFAPLRPTAPAPEDTVAPGRMTDASAGPPRPPGPSGVPSNGLVDREFAAPSPGVDASRPSRGPVTGEPGESSEPKGLAGAEAAGQGSGGGPPAGAGGATLARLPPGEAQGGGASDGAIPAEYEAYVRALRQRIQDRIVYPWTAVRRGQQGVVELEVRLGQDGRLVAVDVVAGASPEALRTAAVAAVRGSAPFPFPPGLAARPLVIRLPVEFRLR